MTIASKARFVLLVLLAASVGCVEAAPAGDDAGVGGNGGAVGSGITSGGGGLAGASRAGTSGTAQSGGGGSTNAGTGGGGSGGSELVGGAASGGSGGGSGSGGASGALPSLGCGLPAAQPIGAWSERPKLSVNNKDRQWWVWLPAGYDPTRAYPVVFTFHGCGGAGNFIPMQEETGSDAIVVRGTGADNGCWTYGGEGDDVKFFDAMLAALQAQYCMDISRVFAMGYSSGGWMTNTLECSRGDKLRATGTLSGGRAGNALNCKGKFARATVHDLKDPTNPFDTQGASKELERVLAQNHCKTDLPPSMEAPAPCARYQGCDAGYPVIACRTQGKGHDRQDALAMEAFWKLFSSL